MAKRFTDTDKYKKPFTRGLQGPYKLLWDFLYHDCDHAGIWIVDFDIAQLYIGHDMPVNKADALRYFNDGEIRIIEIDGGKKWHIVPFIDFQYGDLNEANRAHASVIKILRKNGLYPKNIEKVEKENKPLTSPLQGAMDKDKDKEMDKDKDKAQNFENGIPVTFETLAAELFAQERKILNADDRRAISEIGHKMSVKADLQDTQEIFNRFQHLWAKLAQDERWWSTKRYNLSLLNNNFDEAYSTAFPSKNKPSSSSLHKKYSRA